MERTLVLLKPDSVQRRLVGAIMKRLEDRGLKIIAMKMLWMDRKMARQHYKPHVEKPFFSGLADFITSAPLVALVLEAEGVVKLVRTSVGATDPAAALPGTIRGDWALDIGRNLIHASDSPEEASREIAIFFSPEEILSYKLELETWVTEA